VRKPRLSAWWPQMPTGRGTRRFLLATSVDAVGTGLILPLTALFFTRGVGLGAVEVGAGLSAAGFIGLAASPLIGPALARFEPRRILIACYVLSAAAYGAYPLAKSFVSFLLVVSAAAVSNRFTQPARLGLARDLGENTQDRLRLLAVIATVRNVGFGLGGLATALLLTTNSTTAYVIVALGNAVSYLAVAASLVTLSDGRVATSETVRVGYRSLWRGHPFYFGLSALNAVLLLYDSALVVGLPLWITRATRASPSIAALLFTTNTVFVVLAQTRVSQAAASRRDTARAYRRSGLCATAACLLFALSGHLSVGAAVGVLFVGVVFLTGGELNASAAEWGASLTLAPGSIKDELLGLFGVGTAAQLALGPGVVTLAVVWGHELGWLALALAFAVAGLGASTLTSRIPVSPRERREEDQRSPPVKRGRAAAAHGP
jgi:hypothetical protein